MGAGLSADYAVIEARLDALERLLTDLDAQFGPMNSVRNRQGPGMWSTEPAASGFAAAYQATLDALHTKLVSLRGSVANLHANLAADAAQLARTDQDIQDRLTALAKRLADGPPTGPGMCTVFDVPASDTPAPTPTPTPAPAPTPSPSPGPAPTPPSGGGGGW